MPGRRTHLDHDHLTKLARAFLCDGCNLALGHLKESPVRCRNLLLYILAYVTPT